MDTLKPKQIDYVPGRLTDIEASPFKDDPVGQPAWVQQRCAKHPPRHAEGGKISGVRATVHRGHAIEIKTTYEITIDKKPYRGHLEVGNDGRLYCHATPYDSYDSAVDMMKRVIDLYADRLGPERYSKQIAKGEHGS